MFMCSKRMLLRVRGSILKTLFGILLVISVRHVYMIYDVKPDNDYPILIWWTTAFHGIGSVSKNLRCRNNDICEFTNELERRYHQSTEGFLFYGSDFDYLNLPLPRDAGKYIWALLHEESPRNTPIIQHGPSLQLFNYSSTISRYSDVPLTLQHLDGLEDLLTDKYFVPTAAKNSLLTSKLAPVLYIQTDCETSSYRDSYVKELMKYISVDSYGQCLNNKKLPDNLGGDYLNNLNSEPFLNFVARYKFTISFENAICEDYITEKLWRPLVVGSVPIYMGSPSVRDWLPNDQSVIIADNFESPKILASFIQYLNMHSDQYESYLQHKLSKKITNIRLIKSLQERKWKPEAIFSSPYYESSIHSFECFVCEKIYERRRNRDFKHSLVDQSHYNCPKPKLPSYTSVPQGDRWWVEQWDIQKKKAAFLHKLVVQENKDNFTEADISNFI